LESTTHIYTLSLHDALPISDLRGVRGLPDNSMAARFGDATFAVAFPLGPAGHARLVALAPRDDIGQQEALAAARDDLGLTHEGVDRKSTRLNSSHVEISYAV